MARIELKLTEALALWQRAYRDHICKNQLPLEHNCEFCEVAKKLGWNAFESFQKEWS